MASLDEQETTITFGRTENVARIYTSDTRHLRKLRNDTRATETDGGEDWANFTVPADKVNPLKFFKTTRTLTPEQRQANADRLAQYRTTQ